MNIEGHQLPEFHELSPEEQLVRDANTFDELATIAQQITDYPPELLGRLIHQAQTDDLALSRLPTDFGIYERAKTLRERRSQASS